MKSSESIKTIAAAMNAVRKDIKQPEKNAKNPFFKSDYVTLEGVVDAIDKALPKGFSYTQEVASEGNQVSVSTILMSDSGEWIQFDPLTMPVTKNDAQAFGSAETYARRYSLSAIFGVTSDLDDDGNKATKSAPKEQPRKQTRTRRPANQKPDPNLKAKQALAARIKTVAKEMSIPMKKLLSVAAAKAKVKDISHMTKDDINVLDHELTTELMEFRQSQKKQEDKTAEAGDDFLDDLEV